MGAVNRFLSRSTMEKAAHSMIRTSIRVVLYVLLVLMVVSGLGIDISGLVALFSVLTLAISLAVQGVISNLASGIMLVVTKPFVFNGRDLFVNLSTSARGHLYFTLTDEDGSSIESYRVGG